MHILIASHTSAKQHVKHCNRSSSSIPGEPDATIACRQRGLPQRQLQATGPLHLHCQTLRGATLSHLMRCTQPISILGLPVYDMRVCVHLDMQLLYGGQDDADDPSCVCDWPAAELDVRGSVSCLQDCCRISSVVTLSCNQLT